MKRKKSFIFLIIVVTIVFLIFGGYHIYRYPAMFLNLSDRSLSEQQVEELREEILSKPDKRILVACNASSRQHVFGEL